MLIVTSTTAPPVPTDALIGAILEHLDALCWRLGATPAPTVGEIAAQVKSIADLAGHLEADAPASLSRRERGVVARVAARYAAVIVPVETYGSVCSDCCTIRAAEVLALLRTRGVEAATVAFRRTERPVHDITFEALDEDGGAVAHGVVHLVGPVVAGSIEAHAEVEMLAADEIAF